MNLKSFALGLISILLVAAPTYAKSKKKEVLLINIQAVLEVPALAKYI